MKLLLALSLAFVLSACASASLPKGASPQARVYAAKADYLSVQQAAVDYNRLPRCTTFSFLGSDPCSQPDLVAKMRVANAEAVRLLDAAEVTVRTPGATDNSKSLAIAAAENAVKVVKDILAKR